MVIRSTCQKPQHLVPQPMVDTTSSAIKGDQTQDIVPQNLVPEVVEGNILEQADHSAITEGVSQIFRRKKGGAPTKGFRCTSGPRKGRIVAKPSTCFQKTDPQRSAKIRKKTLTFSLWLMGLGCLLTKPQNLKK